MEGLYSNGEWYRARIMAVIIDLAERKKRRVDGRGECIGYKLAWDDGDTSETIKTAGEVRRRESVWENNFKLLRAYKQRFGHACPSQFETFEGANLGRWVINQRSFAKKGQLQHERVTRLQAIGFMFNGFQGLKGSKAVRVRRVAQRTMPTMRQTTTEACPACAGKHRAHTCSRSGQIQGHWDRLAEQGWRRILCYPGSVANRKYTYISPDGETFSRQADAQRWACGRHNEAKSAAQLPARTPCPRTRNDAPGGPRRPRVVFCRCM